MGNQSDPQLANSTPEQYVKEEKEVARKFNKSAIFDPEINVTLGWHMAQCSICNSPKRDLIEESWVNWCNTGSLADTYHVSRDAIYRHMHAFGLFRTRRQNIARVLERIIEKADFAPASCGQILTAINAYTKLEAEGQRMEPTPSANLIPLIKRMSKEERASFLEKGTLPEWFSKVVAPEFSEDAEEMEEGIVTEQTIVQ